MCRLLLGKKETILRYNEKYNILKLLDHLVNELGGHGNGLVLIKDRKIIYYRKGIRYYTDEVYKSMISKDYDYCIFHTRLASIGEISDENCHPFVYNNSCICMNGTMTEYNRYLIKDNITDTEYLFNKIKDISDIYKVVSILQKKKPSFIGCVDGRVYLVKNLSSIYQWSISNDDFLYASSFIGYESSNEIKAILDNKFYYIEEETK